MLRKVILGFGISLDGYIARRNGDLDFLAIDKKRERDEAKLEKMINLVRHRGCRQQFILDYFGEVSDTDCGVCDVCLKKKKDQQQVGKESVLSETIKELLKTEELNLQDLIGKIKKTDQELIISTIRHMLDSGELEYNVAGNLRLKK